ncbi:MAG: tetrahydromethanopterin S-methyltransferase subunit H, partial [Thermoprotei archaeon]
MFRFRSKQRILKIGSIKIGGYPENPPVLIGTIFYHKHKIVSDPNSGVFDREAAESLISSQEALSEEVGIPALVDVAGNTLEALTKYVDFVAGTTNKPFLVDVLSTNIMEGIAKYVAEVGLRDRVIINSIKAETSNRELKLLNEYKSRNVVVLLYTSQVADANYRVEALQRILPRLGEIGIETPLIDTFVVDPPSLVAATKAALHVKSLTGLPVGCGAHNAVSSSRKFF